MTQYIKSGEEINCPNGHICGRVCIDIKSQDCLKAPDSGRVTDTPISLDPKRTNLTTDGYRCAECSDLVARYESGFYIFHTKFGWTAHTKLRS